MDLRQYADLSILKAGLSDKEFDKIRAILGLLPLREAQGKGQAIMSNIKKNLNAT